MNQPQWQTDAMLSAQAFDQGSHDEAYRLAQQSLAVNPHAAMAHQVIGLVHACRCEPRQAISSLEQALALRPDLVPAHCHLGMCWSMLGDEQQALRHYESALLLQPDHPFARFNRALAWLSIGNYRQGWLEYEWRWRTGQIARPQIPMPRWDGCDPDCKSILFHTEQGIGDTIQFARFLPRVKQMGARVVLACPESLHDLLRNLDGVDEWFPIDRETPINFDWYCPLGAFEASSLRAPVPYVTADVDRSAHWRERIDALEGFKIGVCWQGSPTFQRDALRSIPLEQFRPLGDVEGVTLISLQKVAGMEQIAANRDRLPLVVFDDLDADAAFVDTAAVMEHLDLVITADTAVGHLAGAMGRPVWLLLSTASDWRWLTDRSDSLWYPTARLFRQAEFGDWSSVMTAVVAALQAELKNRSNPSRDAPVATNRVAEQDRGVAPAKPILAPISPGELIDKLTILEIKAAKITDPDKRRSVDRQLSLLTDYRERNLAPSAALDTLAAQLQSINEQLWDIEDAIRTCEADKDFGPRFVDLARSVYKTNDRRAALKRRINDLLGCEIHDEKFYADDSHPPA